jgi:hypothetical protein
MRLVLTTLAGVVLVAGSSSVLAQQSTFERAIADPSTARGRSAANQCPHRKELIDKPLLTGEVIDSARSLGFIWKSGAGRVGDSSWTVQHSICNTGKENLVVTWEKAGIGNGVIAAVPPAGDTVISFGVGIHEPSADTDSPISYGLRAGTSTRAQTYQPAPSDTKTTSLISTMAGTFQAPIIPGSLPPPDSPVTAILIGHVEVEMVFDVRREADGYSLTIYPKGPAAASLLVAISSSQNAAIARGFVKTGHKPFPLAGDKIGLEPREFIIVERIQGRDLNAFIPTLTNRVEIAHVALLVNLRPVMTGKLSLFHE